MRLLTSEDPLGSYLKTINSFFFLQKVLTSLGYPASQPAAIKKGKIK